MICKFYLSPLYPTQYRYFKNELVSSPRSPMSTALIPCTFVQLRQNLQSIKASSNNEKNEKNSLKSSHLFNDGAEMVSEEFLSLQAGEHVHLGGYELLHSQTI